MATNRYAKKVRRKNEAAETRARNALNDMTSYLSEAGAGEGDIKHIALKKIGLNPANDYRRLDLDEDIQVLSDDIARNGLLHNLVVSERATGEYLILSGERRYRALNLLLEKEIKKQEEGKPDADVGRWRTVPCRVIKGLSERQEQIILDAANLQTRGGAGNERLTRMAMERYRDNIKAEYGLTEAQARELLFKITNIGRSSIFRNFKIIDNLIPPFRQLLNEGEITKKEAEAILRLTEKQQIAANRVILAFKARVPESDTDFAKGKKEVIDGILAVSEANTGKEADELLEKLAEKVKNMAPSKKRPMNIRTVEKASYRDNVLKECGDIQNKINRLKKRRPEKIREIDRAALPGEDRVVEKIDDLIRQLEEFRALVQGTGHRA